MGVKISRILLLISDLMENFKTCTEKRWSRKTGFSSQKILSPYKKRLFASKLFPVHLNYNSVRSEISIKLWIF
jgi:hypothetical protein